MMRWIAVLAAVAAIVGSGTGSYAQEPGRPLAGLPTENAEAFVTHMQATRGEDPATARARFALAEQLEDHGDLYDPRVHAAFLATRRHIFAEVENPRRAYRDGPLPIGWGQTISAPHMVGRMTSVLDVEPGHKVLEIGTGSGYQAAMLAWLTPHVYTMEIIEPLAARTEALFEVLIDQGVETYERVALRTGDGYFGWPEEAPFDRILVTAAIDHIPPPLIEQLAVGGIMIIPVGPPGAQVLLEVHKDRTADGDLVVDRRDVYRGRALVSFVPFTREPPQ